jgi:MOSC domain-containing protein YiiM
MARILAVCASESKGTRKKPVPENLVEVNSGLSSDAHAGSDTHRQVSLLAVESINRMRGAGFDLKPGDFAENLTTEGIDLSSLPVGMKLRIGREIVLEITQIGKKCHTGCDIFKQAGICIMPKEGIFARVLQGGVVKAGDELIAGGAS